MNPMGSLRRLISDEIAPYNVAFSRTLTDYNSKLVAALAEVESAIQTAQTAAQNSQSYAADSKASATESAASATSSQSSATTATAAAASATAQLRSFNKRWLGDFPEDPTTDLNGDPVADGAEYFNETTYKIRVYFNGAWMDITAEAAADVKTTTAAAAAAAADAAAAQQYAAAASNDASEAATYAHEAENYYNDLVKFGFPLTLQPGYIPRVKTDNSGYELRSPSDTLSDIGGAPLNSPSFTGTPLSPAVSNWSQNQIVNATSADARYISNGARATLAGNDSTIKDIYFQGSSSSPLVTYGDGLQVNLTTTPQLTAGINTCVQRVSSTTNDYVLSSVGQNRTTNLVWLYSQEKQAFVWLYTQDQIDSKLGGYLPLKGGELTGDTTVHGSLVSTINNAQYYSSNHVGVRADFGTTGQYTALWLGIRSKFDGSAGFGYLTYRDTSGAFHEWDFDYTTGNISFNGGLFATQAWSNNTFAKIGDYATNTTVNNKATALQTSINDLYSNKVTTTPNNTADHRISNFIQSNNWTGNGSAGVGLWTDQGSVIYLADIPFIQSKYVPIAGAVTITNWIWVQGAIGATGQYSSSGSGVGNGMSYWSPSLVSQLSGRSGGSAPAAGYKCGLFTWELSGYRTQSTLSFYGFKGRKDFDFTEWGDFVLTGILYGQATSAELADLAENYKPDKKYPAGTLISIGGEKEVTLCSDPDEFMGVVSSDPGMLLNQGLIDGLPVALMGRVPVRIYGKVKKGDRITYHSPGVATKRMHSNQIKIGRALEDKTTTTEGLVECFIVAQI